MAKEAEHERQLARAAKAILSPLGCKRVGRSRLWIADQRFWVIIIEFQPSGFAKGSYLNAGAMWLWNAKGPWSFDYGYRIEGLTPFEDTTQFAAIAETLAICAAKEIKKLREKFASLSDIARHLIPDSEATGWPLYHAAVAAGLSGDVATSQRLFRRLIEQPTTYDWETRLRANSAELVQRLPELDAFRAAILAIVEQSRESHRLPPDPTCLDTAQSGHV
jgi:hypothetical protein